MDPLYSYGDPTLLLNVFCETRVSSNIQTPREKKDLKERGVQQLLDIGSNITLNSAMEHYSVKF